MFFFLRYQVQECPLFYCFFYYNIFIYFIQITLNVLYDLGGGGGGGAGERETLLFGPNRTWHSAPKLYESHFFLVKLHNTLLHAADLLSGVVGI